MMKILTLFLTLFLTLLPDGAPIASFPQGQDVCMEEMVDVEEEAVMGFDRRVEKASRIDCGYSYHPFLCSHDFFCVNLSASFCFERLWLSCCSLLL